MILIENEWGHTSSTSSFRLLSAGNIQIFAKISRNIYDCICQDINSEVAWSFDETCYSIKAFRAAYCVMCWPIMTISHARDFLHWHKLQWQFEWEKIDVLWLSVWESNRLHRKNLSWNLCARSRFCRRCYQFTRIHGRNSRRIDWMSPSYVGCSLLTFSRWKMNSVHIQLSASSLICFQFAVDRAWTHCVHLNEPKQDTRELSDKKPSWH